MYLFLFWEKQSMRTLLKKNLIQHRSRNKLTSMIYSLTLGCIIFLLVSSTLELKQLGSLGTIGEGDIYLTGKKYTDGGLDDFLFAKDADPVLVKYQNKIIDFAYITSELREAQNDEDNTSFSDHARIYISDTSV